ncbi:MAG: hypothetical protein ABIL09_14225, partial [Gemmatimonadota bacterium]
FVEHHAPVVPDTVVVVLRAGTALPPSLLPLYRRRRLVASLPRAAPGCPTVTYELVLLSRCGRPLLQSHGYRAAAPGGPARVSDGH